MSSATAARALAAAAALMIGAAPASASVHYVGGFDNSAGFGSTFFDVTVADFITTTTTLPVGPNVDCGADFVFFSTSCNSVTFTVDPSGTGTDMAAIDQQGFFIFVPSGTLPAGSFPAGSFSQYGSFTSPDGSYLSVAPGAPAPLLGLGLLPALAGAAGVALTRRRRVAVTFA